VSHISPFSNLQLEHRSVSQREKAARGNGLDEGNGASRRNTSALCHAHMPFPLF
jgi:hypothetical protein